MGTEAILKALSQVQEPDLKKDLVTLNMVRDIVLGDKSVEFISDDVNYHYRLRSNDRQLDIKRMYDLHNKFYGKKKDISNNSYVI